MLCFGVYWTGSFPGETTHGNCKKSNRLFIRTTAEQKAVIAEGLKHGKKPSAIAKDLERVDSENLIDLKVIQNAKYNHDRKQRPANSNSSNMADDVQTIINSLNEIGYRKQ